MEGLVHYEDIENHINRRKANLEIEINVSSDFESKATFVQNLRKLFARYQKSILVLSYTTNGYPSIEDLSATMREFKRDVQVISLGKKPFALNRKNEGRKEVLIIGKS